MSRVETFNRELLTFLASSPSPFHAVHNLAKMLSRSGFKQLDLGREWQLTPGDAAFTTHNDSTLIAFQLGEAPLREEGIRMIGAHTDSPCLKVKPLPERYQHGCLELGTEVYGGALLAPWFDRDLSLAGRVSGTLHDGRLASRLIDFARPIATVPSLAIHLNRDVNRNRTINPQEEMRLVLSTGGNDTSFRELLLRQVKYEHRSAPLEKILDFEICCYDVQPPAFVGINRDFIAAARLDNLLSCFAGAKALSTVTAKGPSQLLICNDHEEVGSLSASGAQGPLLTAVMDRLAGVSQDLTSITQRSVLVSVDNAHAVHPNYADKHDPEHQPYLNGGPVIKINSAQRYATTSETSALFRSLCQESDVPVQTIAVRSDMACGTTIGPITAATLGIPTVDVGVPQLAMHSPRELTGSADPERLYRVLCAFLSKAAPLIATD
ncbi:MAG: M18 family aminopeptidase [Pseudomonadota bacterium]|nr:M18 family aminopeptidase [Pseudomonadota bacterium]